MSEHNFEVEWIGTSANLLILAFKVFALTIIGVFLLKKYDELGAILYFLFFSVIKLNTAPVVYKRDMNEG